LWLPGSPDLTSLDFYLWDYLKGAVYSNSPHTLEELQDNMESKISNVA
jgi:hypothetical protein